MCLYFAICVNVKMMLCFMSVLKLVRADFKVILPWVEPGLVSLCQVEYLRRSIYPIASELTVFC